MKQTAWYTHDGSSQKGPYTENELKTLVVQGQVFPKTFVWKTGMSDWSTWEKVSPEVIRKSETETSPQATVAPIQTATVVKIETSRSRVFFAMTLAILVALAAPKAWEVARFELKLLEMARPEDRTVIKERLKNEPFSLTFSKQQENYHSLLFVNKLPTGSWVKLKLDGNSETLLNRLSAHTEISFQTKSDFDVTPEFRLLDGTLVPAGEYELQIEAEGLANPIQKKIFLGSKNDSTYIAKLKEFHSRIQKKAQTEVQEDEMFLSSLENQLQAILKKPNAEAIARWNGFQTQLKDAISNSTKAALKDQLYYPEVRQSLNELESSVAAIQVQVPASSAVLLPLETRTRVLITEIRAKLEEAKSRFPLKESKF